MLRMDVENDSGDSSLSVIEYDLPTNVLSKLRRLKIQENILSLSLSKSSFGQYYYSSEQIPCPDWKMYSSKVKKKVIEIKTLFEDIKAATSESNENLQNIDIDEVKKEVLNLDEKMQFLEDYISTELISLKRSEEELVKQLNEEPNLENKVKNKFKVQSKHYNAVVPSPLRVFINSPLKCPEVQNFQDFMSKSRNRYGGWNEYNHNIFVQIWKKFYVDDNVVSLERNMQEIKNNNIFQEFMDEVFEKIPGTKVHDVLSHSKWYSEFRYLKMCQKIALDKWKDNKGKIKKRQHVKVNIDTTEKHEKLCRKEKETKKTHQKQNYKRHCETKENEEFLVGCSDICNSSSENCFQVNEELYIPGENRITLDKPFKSKHIKPGGHQNQWRLGFAKPTEQWNNRCQEAQNTSKTVQSNIDSINKLHIPSWRLGLKHL